MNRRDFLQHSTLAAAGLALGPLACYAADRSLPHLGIILGLVAKPMKKDYRATLAALAETGYRYVEFGGTYGADKAAFKAALQEYGLRPLAGGASMAAFQKDLPALIADAQEMGRDYLVCYWPWMHDGNNVAGLDEVKGIAEQFNRIGETCNREGLRFLFHNHDKEFFEVEGRRPYDVLLEETDPALVGMEIDLYWIRKGGGDPLDYFGRYPGRFELCHVKDMDDTPERGITTPGKGIIDFGAIFAQIETAGLRYFIVEQDRAPKPMRNMREAYDYLSALRF
ncbi:MAG: sugar phosphate isomerase/epimerase [Bacteroidia bacterium]